MKNKLQMKKGLAQFGHGKWKSALRHTLLLIGFVMGFGMTGAYAQTLTPIPEGLKMEKKWVSDDPTGRTGNIYVETFVTGHSVAQHVPTDIVLVLDVSGSMDETLNSYTYIPRTSQTYTYNNYGNNTYYYYYNDQYNAVVRERTGGAFNRRYNLHFNIGNTTYYLTDNVAGGITTNINEAQVTGNWWGDSDEPIWTGVLYERHQPTKMEALQDAVCQFVDIIAEDATTYNVEHRISIVKYAMNNYYGSEASITEGNHFTNQNYNYTEVVINRRDPKSEATNIKNAVNGMRAAGATAADYGMSKARYLLASIPAAEFEERNKVVVMFTDGAPTYGSEFENSVATTTISNAHDLKHSWTYNNNTYQFDATVFTVGVFDNETTPINTYMNRVSSNYPDATGMGTNQGGTQASSDYYFTTESADGLADIFEAIAGASGAMSLPASTIVQDMVSPNFQLPEGATGTITAYAPLCTDYNEVTGVYTFEDINDAGTLTIDQIPDPDNPGQYITGVVTSVSPANENKLPANFVTIGNDNKTIQMTGFNFSHHWCGWLEDDHGNKTIHGRKIVIKIPVEVQPGLWGDGIETNNPEQSYVQIGDVYYGPFNILTTNVLGDVWTEVVTSEPQGYNRMDIDTPEELAWFISEVNGRIHYNGNTNNVASNTTLNGKLTADIDMSAHNWVPIGAGYQCDASNNFILDANGKKIKLAYEGEFDGNGHVITGLKNNADRWYKTGTGQVNEVVVYPGMFSNVKGSVHDVFILDSDFRGKAHQVEGKGIFIHHGILADTLTGGTIYNCEAAGHMTCNNDNDNDVNLIYGGLVGLNNGGTIYNAMAMANLTGYTMGGAVGENRSGSSFKNGFTNGEYHYLGENGANAKKVGGLAAINNGTIDNCYVRFERYNENLDKATFNQLVANGNDATNCYTQQLVTWSRPSSQSITTEVNTNPTVPNTILNPADNDENSYTLSVNRTFYNMFTNDNMIGGEWGTLGSFNVYENGTSMMEALNEHRGTGAMWKRTTAGAYSVGAGDINDDFPVLQLPGYTCLASTDGITIDYAHNLSDMLHRHNSGALNENTALGNSYKVTDHAAINGGSINLFANEDMNPSNNNSGAKADLDASYYNTDANVVVYIDENISLLQPTDATSTPSSINAYTGQTLQAFDNTELQAGERWHNISSSLSNSQFGWSYSTEDLVEHNWDSDPCGWNLNNYDEDYAFFPIDLSSYHRGDFYCFYEPQYHWINFRRNSASHWHMDLIDNTVSAAVPSNHAHIDYVNELGENGNETSFIPGKGYLTTVDMSTYWSGYGREAQFMQNRGTLNNGTITIPVSYTAANEWTGLAGYNLLGNPYQSYLDFDAFVSGNATLLANSNFANTYAVYDPEQGNYVQYMSGSSTGSKAAEQYINMHQGFFIQVNEGGTATFTNTMRSNEGQPNFRGEKPAFPLINFIVTDSEGNTDLAILEVNRSENDGAKKLRVGNSTGRIFFRYDDEKLAIFFRDNAEGSQSLHFAAEEDGSFTLNWERANDNFSSLTLVDNITGVKTDMLTHDSYTFEGNTNDYTSRFKIVFGTNNNEDDEEETTIENFAFFNDGNLIVNGEGRLDVIDVLGRIIYSAELTDTQNTVSLPQNAKGVCMLRLTNGDNVKVQKMFVR